MIILIANDDGVNAPGLRTLVRSLSSIAEVYVAAPDRERSATGHAITMLSPIVVEPVEMEGATQAWSLSGTPADCVKLGLEALLEGRRPDLVISGINRGANLGTDILYSGTVSAAMEGVIEGIPSIAVSLASYEFNDFSVAASFAVRLAQRVLQSGIPGQTLLNVNVPGLPGDSLRGVSITTLGVRKYRNVFDRRTDPRGRTYFWMAGELDDIDMEESHDTLAVQEGYVSITPVRFDFTARDVIEYLKDWDFGDMVGDRQ